MASSSHQPLRASLPAETAAASLLEEAATAGGAASLQEEAAAAGGAASLPEEAGAAGGAASLLEEAAAAGGAASLPEDLLEDHEMAATNEQNHQGQGQIVDAGVPQAGDGNNHCSCQNLLSSKLFVQCFYALVFLVANMTAWVIRENPIKYFLRQHHSGCQGHQDCLAAEGVLTMSFACCIFFTIMFISTAGTSTVQDCRNSWHCNWKWLLLKFFLLAPACVLLAVYTPSGWIQLYGKAARFGAGVFLLIQLVSVVRLVTKRNHKWCQTNYENHYRKVIVVSVVTYIGSIVGIILMIYWFTDCGYENIVFIVTTVALGCVMVLFSRLAKMSSGFYMEPGLMGAYIVFLCGSAIKSEPDTRCFKIGKYSSGDNFQNIIAFIFEFIGIIWATFSAGRLRNVEEMENHVPYGYGFFHFVFAMGSMYFGMVLVGWETHRTSEKWMTDVSWTSTWVHMCNIYLAVILFVAVVIARKHGTGRVQELLRKIFGIDGQQQAANNNDAHHIEPGRSDVENVPPSEFHGTELEGFMTDNVPLQQSRATELEGSETDDRPPPSSSSLAELLRVSMSPSSVTGYDSDDIVDWRD